MRKANGIVGVVIAGLLVVTGCSSPGNTTPAAESSSIATTVSYDHEPGTTDVSTMQPGVQFQARPNFHYFEACGRPCYMPLYPQTQLIKGTAVTQNWPCEARDTTSISRGPLCADRNDSRGDWAKVICQSTGMMVQNLHPDGTIEQSNIWDWFEVSVARLTAKTNTSKLRKSPSGHGYLVAGPDIWFGNTSRDPRTGQPSLAIHRLPCPI